MLLSRRSWAGLIAALPAIAVSLRFFDVNFNPDSGANRQWAEDAKLLVRIELVLLFVTAFTAWIASQVTAVRRAAAMSALAAVFGAIVYGMWLATDGAQVVLGAGLLIAGRFLAAVIAGPEAVAEFTERALVNAVFYLAILFAVQVLPGLLPSRYGIHFPHPEAAFCAFYFLLLALLDAARIYARTPEPASGRPTVRLGGSNALTQSSLVLRFAGDAFEVVDSERERPAGRILAFFAGVASLGVALSYFAAGRWHFSVPGMIPLLAGGGILLGSLIGGASASILQVRRGGLALLELSRQKVATVVNLPAAEIGLAVIRRQKSEVGLIVSHKGHNKSLMVIDCGLADEAAAGSLKHLFELYLSGDPSPHGLRKALDADPDLAALLGPEVVGRLLAAPPMTVRDGTMACPDCKNELAASAPHCGYCGLLYPALGD
jgi:hypothetical protein